MTYLDGSAQFAWFIRICGILKMIITNSYFGTPCVGTFPFFGWEDEFSIFTAVDR